MALAFRRCLVFGQILASLLAGTGIAIPISAEGAQWSGETSEEYPPLTASPGQLIGAMNCRGSYCDNINLFYQNVPGVTYGSNSWTSYFSEEGPNNSGICSRGYFMTGLSCRGHFATLFASSLFAVGWVTRR